jgi:hypothetical protein
MLEHCKQVHPKYKGEALASPLVSYNLKTEIIEQQQDLQSAQHRH